MFTRSQLQSKAGLSRKELRNIEAKGLLNPLVFSEGPAMFREEDLEVAKLVHSLRVIGISFDTICRLFEENSSDAAFDEAQELLRHKERDLKIASEYLVRHRSMHKKKVRKRPYGGFWALSKTARLDKLCVPSFVSEFVHDLEVRNLKSEQISVHYENETHEQISVACYSCQDKGVNDTGEMNWSFVPEYRLYGLEAAGFVGEYDCFDSAYDKINEERFKQGAQSVADETVEIYMKYPSSVQIGRSFEAIILS